MSKDISKGERRKKWEINIRKARGFITNYDKSRWVISKLALEVCDIYKGGRRDEHIFSLQKFAGAIELNEHTLYEWCRAYQQVVQKLPKVTQQNIHTFPYADVRDVLLRANPESTPKEVKSFWEEVRKINPDGKRFGKYCKTVRSVLYNAERPMLMKDVPEQHINTMIGLCEGIVRLLRKELELRTKFSASKQTEAKQRLNLKKEIHMRMGEARGT